MIHVNQFISASDAFADYLKHMKQNFCGEFQKKYLFNLY